MPLDVNLIQRGELQARLARGLGIRERSPAPTLATEVQAVVMLEDLTETAEPRIERPCSGGAYNLIPTVAEYLHVQLLNPAGSGVVLLVDDLWINVMSSSTGLALAQTETVFGTLLTANQKTYRDTRLTGGPSAEIRSRSAVTAISPTLGSAKIGSGTFSQFHTLGIVLDEGDAFVFGPQAVTIGLDFIISWRERTIDA